MSVKNLRAIIEVARGLEIADLILKNARVVDILGHSIIDADIAVYKGVIAGIGKYKKAKKIIDLKSSYLCPSFIDGHIHIESSLLSPFEFAKVVIPHGTGSCVIDPHEIANVLGVEGIKFMMENAKALPIDIYCMLSSCVPATPFETAGANIGAKELKTLINHPRVLGLAEMMNFPGVVFGQKDVLEKIEVAGSKIIDGHCPFLSGEKLCAYITAGISSEHEAVTLEEAREKLSRGMYIMIREGSTAKNLKDLAPLIIPETFRRLMFVSDDKHPHDILKEGHLDAIIRKAISLGVDPFIAISMASFNSAQYFGLAKRGAVACGFSADMVTFKNLKKIDIDMVFKDGKLVARKGQLTEKSVAGKRVSAKRQKAMNVNSARIKAEDFKVPAKGKKIRVIGVIPNQIITNNLIEEANIADGVIQSDVEKDILKIVVMERYSGEMGRTVGFVKGFGLKKGAIASSVAHDSHNLIAVGTNDADLAEGLRFLAVCGGGLCCIKDGKVTAQLELPIAGLMSFQKAEMVADEMDALIEEACILGSKLDNPFMALSFLALPVIPNLKITDKGIFDVNKFEFVDLFV
ncbi:MAG: adenine deaminase [Candidatus Omnitrophota bacterium]